MNLQGRKFSAVNSSYRYGFNGQEKDNEVYGTGNLNTAEYWEYDSRIGRRWNTDPKQRVEESPYLCFRGNPIFLSDPLGDVSNGPGPKGLESTEAKDYKKTKGYKNLGNYWKEKDKSSRLELVNGVYIYSRDQRFDFGRTYYWTTGVANKKGDVEWTQFDLKFDVLRKCLKSQIQNGIFVQKPTDRCFLAVVTTPVLKGEQSKRFKFCFFSLQLNNKKAALKNRVNY